MQNIVGTRIHDEIIGLVDRAARMVVLVSPFVRVWPELARALARAVSRGVEISLITRGPHDGPRDDELAIFVELEIPIREVPELHLKAYLSESEAIHTSVNLTRNSLGSSVDSSLLFDRKSDAEGWNNVFEVWQKTVDDAKRAADGEYSPIESLLVDIRTRAEDGDDLARDEHRFCILCGQTASAEAANVVCLWCRASAIAENGRSDEVIGNRCTRCNGQHRRSTVERPLCEACYRLGIERYRNRPVEWYVAGATGSVNCWWAADRERVTVGTMPAAARSAIARRWPVLMPKCGWVTGTITVPPATRLPLWSAVCPPVPVDIAGCQGLLAERVPTAAVPHCRDLAGLATTHSAHLVYAWHPDSQRPVYWTPERSLAGWNLDLPGGADGAKVLPAEWMLRVTLASRRGLVAGPAMDPSRGHLIVALELGVPAQLRNRWREAAEGLAQAMLSGLHTFDEADLRVWLQRASPEAVDVVVGALTTPGPLGLAPVRRSSDGKVRELPHRSDRVAAMSVALVDADTWHLKGGVFKAKRVAVN